MLLKMKYKIIMGTGSRTLLLLLHKQYTQSPWNGPPCEHATVLVRTFTQQFCHDRYSGSFATVHARYYIAVDTVKAT